MTDVELDLGDLGTLEGVGVEGITDLDRPSLLEEAFHELVIDSLLYEDT